jgi:hypothetical protein
MTNHWKFSLNPKAVAVAALVAPALASHAAELACSSTPLNDLSGAVACRALELSPSILTVAWQALHTMSLGQQDSVLCPLHLLVSFLPLLRFLAGVA